MAAEDSKQEEGSNGTLPNDLYLTGYSRWWISVSAYKDKIIPYSVLCDLIFIYYPVIDSKPLESMAVHSCRGDKQEYLHGFDSLQPKNILAPDAKLFYASEISSKFTKEEPNDWIIFKDDSLEEGKWYPFSLDIQNRDWDYIYANRVKKFSFYIGSSELKKWIKLKPEIMEMDVNEIKIQSFELEYTHNDWINIKKYKLNEFKLELIENAKEPKFIYSKFCLRYFRLHGLYQLQ